jgi:pimeloyl-ACP methyl ester carboxylesterase
MDATYLDLIECPVRVATGGASDPMYATIAAGLLERIPRAEHVRFPGQGHMAPVLQPEVVAAAIMAWFAALGGGRSQP